MTDRLPRNEDALTVYQSEVLNCVHAYLRQWGRGETVVALARECNFKPTRHFRQALKKIEELHELTSWVAYQKSGHLARFYDLPERHAQQMSLEGLPF